MVSGSLVFARPRRLVGIAARTAAAALVLSCGTTQPDSVPAADPASSDELVAEQVEDQAKAPGVQMALQQRTETQTGIATDPVAEKTVDTTLGHLRAVARAGESAPTDPAFEPADIEPLAYRIARQTLIVRTEPNHRAPLRGRIPQSEAFEVFAFVDGEGADADCDGLGWAEVGGGYVCLERSRKAGNKRPQTLPKMRDRGLTPYYYAKVPKGKVAEQWASIADYRAGKPSIATLETDHDYAFVSRRIFKGELFLFDSHRRVTPEKQVARFYPSTFEGTNLEDDPVPTGTVLAWTTAWPETAIRVDASLTSALGESADYHARVFVDPEPVNGYYRVADGSGFVHGSDIRRFTSPAPLDGSAAGETWIDIDLDAQVLTVMRGKTAVFATMVSSGFKAPTPRGIFRIRLKQASGTMSSNPGDADRYAVEEVPHVQYFFQSFALHSAYWHNRFGHKMSHGCVNLSPKDAKTVFEATGPHPRDGWLHAYESESDLGTSVRIRSGDTPVTDRRGEVEPAFGHG